LRARPRFPGTRPTRFGHPNEGRHNRINYRIMEQALAYAAESYARGRLVDIGCGSKPWRGAFAPYVDEHVGVDHVDSKRRPGSVDVIAGAYEIPLEDGHADTILMSAVLEHLEQPARAMTEAYRLLAPGGHVIVTTPLFWPLHEVPRDFFRYTPYGLRFLMEEAGFEPVEVIPLSGVWTTMSLELSYALRRYRRGPVLSTAVDGVSVAAQWLAARWEQVDFQPQFSWNHLAVGTKPAA
jgi:SAM-dependent methyltransferase